MRHLVVLLTFIFHVTGSPLFAQPSPVMVISGNPEAPPVAWNKQGKLQGVGPKLATDILSQLNIQYSIQPATDWLQVQQQLVAGEVDLIVSAYKNKKREQHMVFSAPYLESPVVAVVKKGDRFICNCWEDMIGKKGVAGQGESFGDDFDAYIKDKLDVTYTPYQRAFEMLEEDTADYLIIDLYPAIIYSKLLMVEDKIEFMEKPIVVQQLHMAISKKSPYLDQLPAINNQLKQLKAAGKIKKLAIDQYNSWHKTFKERQHFYAKAQKNASDAQATFNAEARDRGLDNLARFIEEGRPYMEGGTGH
ncbi:substrate-binding periplasmic protein [Desulfogranum marinum]|uniref:substrate-binding periplasmic protein n=1 Tax=Desulfogranum marinum TaxID=453220 RepID=UPI00196634D9|nr:transporter substrate-binding domain-containing protein [Desulfogranum marinum]MBM9510864.1 transporter substrate-binding domain-containing protein [Desulfogranum marinum]